jgi:hypothetical protein
MTETRPTPERTPTLLVFTLGAGAESRRRSLLPPRLRGAERGLHRGALDAALAAGRDAGCRLEISSPAPLVPGRDLDPALAAEAGHRPQLGRGFGPRLEQAVDGALAAGGGPVVVVGSDTPALASGHLRAALCRLAEDPRRVVAGPSPDGGFYLLATARPLPGLAAGVRWRRRDALASLARLVAAAGRELVLIEPLADLDRPADLERWLASGSATR